MLLIVALAFGALAFGPQVVFSINFQFKISQVEQCEPVAISFIGDAGASPLTLTLLPFDSRPVSIPIPGAAARLAGVYVTPIPFPAGTSFVASLDDITGENVASISDIITVLPSPTGNTTCLPPVHDTAPDHFTLSSDLSQCKAFTVTYNNSVTPLAPDVRLFNPEGPSFKLRQVEDDPTSGRATYFLNFSQGKKVVLVFDDRRSIRETTPLLTIDGDTTSDSSCLLRRPGNSTVVNGTNVQSNASPTLSQGAIIGLSAGGGVVALIALFMIIFIVRERRRRQRIGVNSDPTLLEKGRSDTPQLIVPSVGQALSEGFVRDPPYTFEAFLSPTTSVYPRTSRSSWSQVIHEDHLHNLGRQGVDSVDRRGSEGQSTGDLTLNSLDIEGILNMAATHSDRNSRATMEPTPIVSASPQNLSVPQAIMTFPSRGHLRDPSDIPVGPTSMTFSSYSINPFSDDNVTNQMSEVIDAPRSSVQVRPPSVAIIGLPSSRNSTRLSRERSLQNEGIGAALPVTRASRKNSREISEEWHGTAQ